MRDHKSLLAWQEARKVVQAVFEGSRTCWKPYAAAVFAQLQRACLSVQLNIAEEQTEKLKEENKELVDRWMARKGKEADAMNDSLLT